MSHFLDRYAFEKVRQRPKALIIQMEGKKHVLTYRLKSVSYTFVQQSNALFLVHNPHLLDRSLAGDTYTRVAATNSAFGASVLNLTSRNPALLSGFMRKVTRYWCER